MATWFSPLDGDDERIFKDLFARYGVKRINAAVARHAAKEPKNVYHISLQDLLKSAEDAR